MTVIISPHLDDAVLSLGQYLDAIDDVTVVTVFAGLPARSYGVSAYDASCGFVRSREAVRARRDEDAAALAELGCAHVHLGFLDNQYRQRARDAEIIDALRPYVSPDFPTYVPLGIGHPDHEQVARCSLLACPPGFGLRLYEELPYRVQHPEQVVDALGKVRAQGFAIGELPLPLEVGRRSAKERAIGLYRSQFPNGADDPCLLVPERAWQVERCA